MIVIIRGGRGRKGEKRRAEGKKKRREARAQNQRAVLCVRSIQLSCDQQRCHMTDV